MFMRNDVTYEFHHIGIPTHAARDGERQSPQYATYASDSDCQLVHIHHHRFEADSPLRELMQTVPHAAFTVDNLDRAIDAQQVILGPYEAMDGFRVAVIVDDGLPVELIQSDFADDEIWSRLLTARQASPYATWPRC